MNDHQKQVFSGAAIMLITIGIGFVAGMLVAHQNVDYRLSEAQALIQKIDNKTIKICE